MPHCRTTVLTSTFVLTTSDKMPTLHKIKRGASRQHKANAFAPHLILPQRTKLTHHPNNKNNIES